MSEIQVGDVVTWPSGVNEWRVLFIDGDRAGIKRLDVEIWEWAWRWELVKVEPMVTIEISLKAAQYMKSGRWFAPFTNEIATACRKALKERSEG